MGPSFALLSVTLASFLVPAGCCVLCSTSVVEALKSLEKDVLPNRLDAKTLKDLMEKMKKELNFDNLPLNENSFMGVIDEDTLEQTSNNFLRDLKHIVDGSETDGAMVQQILWMLHQQKEAFAKSVARFLKEAYCPNKCGIMLQPLIWCANCQKQIHTCRKSYDCGEQNVEVHEMEDMILDCQLNWHHASQGLTDYNFYRVWGNNSETLVKSGKEAFLTKHFVNSEDAGKYRCELGTVDRGPATIIHFQVKVLPRNFQEEKMSPNIVVSGSDNSDGSDIWSSNFHQSNIQSSFMPTSKADGMLRGRLFGLLICISVVLIACMAIWLVYRRKPKAESETELKSKEAPEEATQKTAPQTTEPSNTELAAESLEEDQPPAEETN